LGALAALSVAGLRSAQSADAPIRIVAFGDSLTAGYGLPAAQAFPVRLAQALAGVGLAAAVTNAGVSGDTASGGLARLDWSVPDDTEAVILELGANDMLRGLDPAITRNALDDIMARLSARGIEVLIAGMRAAPNLGGDFGKRFEAIFPDLAGKYGALLYPFFLDGLAADPKLNQRDGLHPTAAGVDVIVAGILPMVDELVRRVMARRKLSK
jgi:acyl-CoA thioesterase-1